MTFDMTWTWDVIEAPAPAEPAAPAGQAFDSPLSLSKLFAAIFDSFRDEPAIYDRLADIVKSWREGIMRLRPPDGPRRE